MSRNSRIFTTPFIWRFQLPEWPFQRQDGAATCYAQLNRDSAPACPSPFRVLTIRIECHVLYCWVFWFVFLRLLSILFFSLWLLGFLLKAFSRWKLQSLILKLSFPRYVLKLQISLYSALIWQVMFLLWLSTKHFLLVFVISSLNHGYLELWF